MGPGRGGMLGRLGWGAASLAWRPLSRRCGQPAAASGEETQRHLPNIAPTAHLPAERRRYPKHVFPSGLSLIQADPLPAGTGADLPWGSRAGQQDGSHSGVGTTGRPPKFPTGHTSHPAVPRCRRAGSRAVHRHAEARQEEGGLVASVPQEGLSG